MNSLKRFLRFLGGFARESLYWIFFSVVISLIHFWVSFLVSMLSHYPLQLLVNDTLFVFSIVLMATSFGAYYQRVDRKQLEWISLCCIIVGSLGIGVSIILCTLSIISPIVGEQHFSAETLYYTSKMLSVYALAYGFFLNTVINLYERRILPWRRY